MSGTGVSGRRIESRVYMYTVSLPVAWQAALEFIFISPPLPSLSLSLSRLLCVRHDGARQGKSLSRFAQPCSVCMRVLLWAKSMKKDADALSLLSASERERQGE